jgi:hypothetical protein
MADARRAGITTLVALLAGAPALAQSPFDLAALRVAGVSLQWWYAGFAPLVAVLVATVALRRSRSPDPPP